ncbi:MAG: hypothetical protein ACLQB1_32190 [Streptosporangiaceae bacterium]
MEQLAAARRPGCLDKSRYDTRYTGVLAAADIEVFTTTTTFAIMQSLRLDRGPSGPVHP